MSIVYSLNQPLISFISLYTIYIIIYFLLANSREPIHINEFPDHVANMHSNDDYIFSVEYPV